jgi:hypothetical protein
VKVIRQFRGVRIGSTADVYETPLAVDRETAIDKIAEEFEGCLWGRAFDGAHVLSLSRWRVLAFYLTPNLVRFEVRHSFPLQIRLSTGPDRRKIERISRLLGSNTQVA